MSVLWPTDLAKLSLQQHLLLSTVRLEVHKPNGMHTGTGAFMELQVRDGVSINAIVTNRHVLQNGLKFFGRFRRKSDDYFVIDEGVLIELSPPTSTFIEHPSPLVDIAFIVIPALSGLSLSDGSRPGAVTISDRLFVSEEAAKLQVGDDITMVGYPVGLYDTAHNLPIARRGTLATHYAIDFCARPEFVVDIGAFRGSSGSPIFLMNVGSFFKDNQLYAGSRLIWLGMLWGGQVLRQGAASPPSPVPTAVDALDATDIVPLNLAHCVKAENILEARAHIVAVLRELGHAI